MKVLALVFSLALEMRHESVHKLTGHFPLAFAPSTDRAQESLGLEAGLGFLLPGLSLRGGPRWRFQAEDVAWSIALRYDLIREKR